MAAEVVVEIIIIIVVAVVQVSCVMLKINQYPQEHIPLLSVLLVQVLVMVLEIIQDKDLLVAHQHSIFLPQ